MACCLRTKTVSSVNNVVVDFDVLKSLKSVELEHVNKVICLKHEDRDQDSFDFCEFGCNYNKVWTKFSFKLCWIFFSFFFLNLVC
jgi:hypothetical protein